MLRLLALLVLAAMPAWADFIDEQVGGATSVQATCTGTSSVVSDHTPNVRCRTILNQSSTDVFLCFAPVCTTATGTRFQQNMGLLEYTYTGPISCVTGGGTATVGVTVR